MKYIIKYIIFFILGLIIYKLLNNVDTLIFRVDDSIAEDLYRDKYNWENDCSLCAFKKLFKNPIPEKTFENLASYDDLGLSKDEVIVNLKEAISESNISEYLKNKLYITVTPIFSKYKMAHVKEKTLYDGFRYLFSLLSKNEAIYIGFKYEQERKTHTLRETRYWTARLSHAAILYKDSFEKFNYVGTNDIGIKTDNIQEIINFFEKDKIYIIYLYYYNGTIRLNSDAVPLIIDVNENDPVKKFSYRLKLDPFSDLPIPIPKLIPIKPTS